MKQKTIKNEVQITGIGLHTGTDVKLTLKPADIDAGIHFVRVDLPDSSPVKVEPSNLCPDEDIPRCSAICNGKVKIYTVEHLLSALWGLEISNITIEIDSQEVPGLDGSSIEFLETIKKGGIVEQDKDQEVFVIKEPIGIETNGSSIFIFPSDELKISYTLDYDNPIMRSQFYESVITKDIYEKEIAPCRTFCLESEAAELQKNGLGKGANHTNTLVVSQKGVIDNEVLFPDEFARHKILDIIGDLFILGIPVIGHIFAVKSGHYLNTNLLKKIGAQREKYLKNTQIPVFDTDGCKEIDIHGIMKILPHRYPFLLVDRVVELERGQKAIGIKNVTINDDFFQGHFPTRPVMPGVLMVEAMAQTAGVVILTNEAHRGKVAFFMAINNVKFRKVVTPGDQLRMEVEVVRDKAKFAQVRGISRVNGEIVAEADMVFSFTDVSFLE